jgi:hypothetical protein
MLDAFPLFASRENADKGGNEGGEDGHEMIHLDMHDCSFRANLNMRPRSPNPPPSANGIIESCPLCPRIKAKKQPMGPKAVSFSGPRFGVLRKLTMDYSPFFLFLRAATTAARPAMAAADDPVTGAM